MNEKRKMVYAGKCLISTESNKMKTYFASGLNFVFDSKSSTAQMTEYTEWSMANSLGKFPQVDPASAQVCSWRYSGPSLESRQTMPPRLLVVRRRARREESERMEGYGGRPSDIGTVGTAKIRTSSLHVIQLNTECHAHEASNMTREITHKSFGRAFVISSSHHQRAILHRAHTVREASPGPRRAIAPTNVT